VPEHGLSPVPPIVSEQHATPVVDTAAISRSAVAHPIDDPPANGNPGAGFDHILIRHPACEPSV
jgi:hypothetical protein